MKDLGSEAGDGIDVGDERFVVGDLAGDPLVDRSSPPGRRSSGLTARPGSSRPTRGRS